MQWLGWVEVEAEAFEHAIEATRGTVIAPGGHVFVFTAREIEPDEEIEPGAWEVGR